MTPIRNETELATGWISLYEYESPNSFKDEEVYCSVACAARVMQARADAATMIAAHEAAEAASEARKPCWGCGKIDCPLWIDPDEWQKDREEGE